MIVEVLMNIIRKVYHDDGKTLLAVIVDKLPASCYVCDQFSPMVFGSSLFVGECLLTDCPIVDQNERAWHCPLHDENFPL